MIFTVVKSPLSPGFLSPSLPIPPVSHRDLRSGSGGVTFLSAFQSSSRYVRPW